MTRVPLSVRIFDGQTFKRGGLELLPPSAQALGPKHRLWVDVQGPTPGDMNELTGRFGLHRLAVDDCMHLGQRPKLEDYTDHYFIVLQGFRCPHEQLDAVELRELHFFFSHRWLITVHATEHEAVAQLDARLDEEAVSLLEGGVDRIVHLLADAQVDTNFPVVDALNAELETLEDGIFDSVRPEQMQTAFGLKRTLVQLRRVLSPQRDVIGLLSRGIPPVGPATLPYFRDVYDHLIRLHEQIDTARDLLGNVMDAYLSVMANRTGEITKQLTVFASIFMPLSFIAGFFGQNFDLLSQPHFFKAMIGAMLLVPVGMAWWFWHKRWW
jgi:magnesium transporter